MSHVTFQIISGMEQGRTLDLATPVTIGREEENSLRLNDDRVSRFHAKIQEDSGSIVLTDLDSTNGTRVNGLPVQMRVLQVGDHVSVGRSILVYGSPEQVVARLRAVANGNKELDAPTRRGQFFELEADSDPLGEDPEFFPNGPPELPPRLRPVQAAQVSDVLSYLHAQLGKVIEQSSEVKQEQEQWIEVPQHTWQRLLQLEMTLAKYLLRLSEPEES
ncbi:MAG: FHA domain-containing protein [Planctomycetota bacterium]|jgi:pSer/pThr/pTyr-binding forkhead associated (FHA) protein